jgi:hypothetical protein
MSTVFAPASFSFCPPTIYFSVKHFQFMGLPPLSIQRWKIPVRHGVDIDGQVKQR